MARLALSRDLLDDFHRLEKRSRTKVSELADTFSKLTAQELRESKGIHLESHKVARDKRARTIRIDDNHRGIVLDVGDNDTYILTRIGTHAETDRWMAKNEVRVNERTGALEIVDVEAIETAAQSAPTPQSTDHRLFDHRSDKDFIQLGIEPSLLPLMRVLTNEDQLEPLLGVLPQGQAETLILLTGTESTDAIYAAVAGSMDPKTIDIRDVVTALDAPATKAQFRVVADDDDLAKMLALPLAQWRVFLHPSQREAAYRDGYNGPARITGGAGTGKTVVAMHRAIHLARRYTAEPGTPVLFTTFTRNLAQVIQKDLQLLAGPDVTDRIEVLNVDALAHRVVRDAEGSNPRIASGEDLRGLWEDVVHELGSNFDAGFLRNEWEQIVLAQQLSSRSDYFNTVRAGRGVPLDRRARAETWKAIEAFTQKLVDRNARTYLQLAAAGGDYLAQRSVKPYRHIVVDEAQDLHEAQWRLVRSAVAEGPDDLFIVGDSHQRIYSRRASLKSVGIEVVGRSRKLRINYRTTHEILGWALGLLGEKTFDDLDQGTDPQGPADYHSYLHGPPPTVAGFGSAKEQFDALVLQVRGWVDADVDEDEIAVAVRTSAQMTAVEHALRQAGLSTHVLKADLAAGDGVRVATMHRLKGLEFRCVALVDVDDDHLPHQLALTEAQGDPVELDQSLRRELCLLYVACTRARDHLWVSWSGKNPSRFLQPVLGSVGSDVVSG